VLFLRWDFSLQGLPFKLTEEDPRLELIDLETANDSIHMCLPLGMAGEVLLHSTIIYSLSVICITLKLNGWPPIFLKKDKPLRI
jgi:hypothetical protein